MFFFRQKKRLEGTTVDLELEEEVKPSRFNQYVPSFNYGIYLHGTRVRIGYCDLRVGENDELYYAGNIGYRINAPYRGHHYALDASRLLLSAAKEKDMDHLYITCSPENIASKTTIEQLGGLFQCEEDVPVTHWLYQRGETKKLIYLLLLR